VNVYFACSITGNPDPRLSVAAYRGEGEAVEAARQFIEQHAMSL
jgi:hypothetical protein